MKTNKISLWKLLKNSSYVLLFAGLTACGGDTSETAENTGTMDETTAMEDVGQDTDTWDNTRFNSSFSETGRYGGWDENNDNMLDENEYFGSYYDTWDTNKDNNLDQNEWNTGVNDFGVQNATWSDWDTNKDNNLDENEFRTGMKNNNNFSTWDKDKDNMLNEQEYSEGVFGQWDRNADGTLDNNEYNNSYNRYYGTDHNNQTNQNQTNQNQTNQ